MRQILYLSYDGLLDNLGQSQILPYIIKLNATGYKFHIISFEKRGRVNFQEQSAFLKSIDIEWTPLKFTVGSSSLLKAYDLIRFVIKVLSVVAQKKYDLVHARGHVSAFVAYICTLFVEIPIIFDYRGMWVEERVDKGGWNPLKAIDRFEMRLWRNFESKSLGSASKIIVLTAAMRDRLNRTLGIPLEKIEIIPCCVDFEKFRRVALREERDYSKYPDFEGRSFCVGYVGSAGPMYKPEDFLSFCEYLHSIIKKLRVIIASPDKEIFDRLIEERTLKNIKGFDITLSSIPHRDIPQFLQQMDLLITFVREGVARESMSPTRIPEAWASGVPVISNSGVGDLDTMMVNVGGGELIDNISRTDVARVMTNFTSKAANPNYLAGLPERARRYFSLDVGVMKYMSAYGSI